MEVHNLCYPHYVKSESDTTMLERVFTAREYVLGFEGTQICVVLVAAGEKVGNRSRGEVQNGK